MRCELDPVDVDFLNILGNIDSIVVGFNEVVSELGSMFALDPSREAG